ncbi:Ser-Thr-rich glycosyl-phosphatidyl-inositol-anchored membrane family-domain-containing protein [Dichotomopilus funicola]|uniref:Ser-Thr-rich glycosyl-phosphatidyl-inositol-anchored membrane family-domain-containing protein n=1 Tax=Dichotomopilus funicola TaxID=1934379 RepID=A0AAN6ZN02_9PEZI|nr:Ser-Thr-rich glycosyl-phosphatidyl-inositol-anchored membrane family-domain-containing protein [Dichotomopilus funicola]
MRFLSLLALGAPLVSAIQFFEPIANATLHKGSTYPVKWHSVDTDPSTFSIYLVNFVDWPPFYTQVASGVKTVDGEYEVTVPCDVDSSWGFQFNAINGTNVYIIHAQTSKFSIRDGDCSGSGPTTLPAPPTCEATTVTKTVTVTASASQSSETESTIATTITTSATTPTTVEPPQLTTTSPPVTNSGAGKPVLVTSTITSTVYAPCGDVCAV